MRIISFVFQVTILYGLYLAGSWIQDSLNLVIPGSIIGMMILFFLLLTGLVRNSAVEAGSSFLIRHLPLLFLPVTVGIIQYTGLFKGKGMLLFLIVIISTLLVMLVSGFISNSLWKRMGENDG